MSSSPSRTLPTVHPIPAQTHTNTAAKKLYWTTSQPKASTVASVENGLRTWRVKEQELKDLAREAETIADREELRKPERFMRWARVEVRAPQSGTITGTGSAAHG